MELYLSRSSPTLPAFQLLLEVPLGTDGERKGKEMCGIGKTVNTTRAHLIAALQIPEPTLESRQSVRQTISSILRISSCESEPI